MKTGIYCTILHVRIQRLLLPIIIIIIMSTTIQRHAAKAFLTRHIAAIVVGAPLSGCSSSIIPTTTAVVGDVHNCRRRRVFTSSTAFFSSTSDQIPRTTNINSQQQPTVPSSSSSSETSEETIRLTNKADETSSNEYDLYRPYFPIYYNDVYEVDLPPGHRFPMGKYRRVRDIVQKKVLGFSEEERALVQSGRIPRITPCHNGRPRPNTLPKLHRPLSQR